MSEPQLPVGKEAENLERRGLKKGLYLVPSLFTAGNILMRCGMRLRSTNVTSAIWVRSDCKRWG